uniref:DDE-1 domain-containing protein n=1 Tax=Heterorhabditis bacteriophora TaxID=37862 RepID=A0A1I7W6K6_HETBA
MLILYFRTFGTTNLKIDELSMLKKELREAKLKHNNDITIMNQDLQRVVSKAWNEIDNSVIKNLINIIPERNFQINRSGKTVNFKLEISNVISLHLRKNWINLTSENSKKQKKTRHSSLYIRSILVFYKIYTGCAKTSDTDVKFFRQEN